MKKIISSILIVSSLFAVSCSKEMLNKSGTSDVTLGATLEQQIQSKTALGTGNTVVWSANDKLSVLSSANSVGGDEFTLKTGAGEVAGTFKGTLSTANSFFALYPYSTSAELFSSYIKATLPATQTYTAGSFAKGANLSLAPFEISTADQLSFKNVMGVLELQLKGTCTINSLELSDRSGNKLSGEIKIETAGENNTAMLSGTTGVKLVCDPAVTLKADEATKFYIVLPVGSLNGGFDVDIVCTDGHRYLRSANANTINRSTIRVMPEKTLSSTPDSSIDLSEEGTSNCYIVSAVGSYRFFAGSKGNAGKTPSLEHTLNVDHVALLWSTDNTANEQTEPIINNVTYDNGYVYFSSKAILGNAVIAAYNSNDEIIWSWHIWRTGVPADKGPFVNEQMLMDRDLGAISATPGDLGCAGLRYQYGRKDPFVGSADYTKRAEEGGVWSVYGIARTTKEEKPTLDDWIKNPTVFYYWSDSSCSTGSGKWGATKTIYDPCPVGYQLPAWNPWKVNENEPIITTTGTWLSGWSFSYKGNDLGFFPGTGFYRNHTGENDYTGNGYDFCYSGRSLMMSKSGPFQTTSVGGTSYGLSARCAKTE